MLWAWFIALMGVIFMRNAKQFETHAMLFLNVVQGFFLVLLIKASPFATQAQIPPDGAGLNPLLQNFWMVIHPPVLFLGYAAASFPLVLALTALIKRDYQNFGSLAMPWTLFTSITLGAGIILGAYWAYGTLGWGGYWGWDPVENSSLIPWLVNIALVHGLIVEKIKGSLKKSNLLLAIISFVLVIYSTFLTRSGVLADFSVHSFSELGINSYLIVFMLSALGFGLFLFTKRFREIPGQPLDFSKLNKENALVVSMFVFLGSAVVTLVGTSSPILTGLLGQPSTVNLSYYNQVNLPFGLAMMFLLGLTPLLKWGTTNNGFVKKLSISLTLTGVVVLIAILNQVYEPLLLLFIGTVAFAFWSNGFLLIQQWRSNLQYVGAPLAHLGVALMILGVIVSGNFSQEKYVVLSEGEPQTVLEHQMVYEGTRPSVDGKDWLNIRISNQKSEYMATPKLYFTEYNQSMMREPHIEFGWLQDFYVSPLEKIQQKRMTDHARLDLKKGESKRFADYEIRFTDFEMHSHGSNGTIKIGANLNITNGAQSFSVTPALLIANNQRKVLPIKFPATASNGQHPPTVMLEGINANEKSIRLAFAGMADNPEDKTSAPEQVAVQVSTKPFMNILWLGTVLLTVGTAISLGRRKFNKV